MYWSASTFFSASTKKFGILKDDSIESSDFLESFVKLASWMYPPTTKWRGFCYLASIFSHLHPPKWGCIQYSIHFSIQFSIQHFILASSKFFIFFWLWKKQNQEIFLRKFLKKKKKCQVKNVRVVWLVVCHSCDTHFVLSTTLVRDVVVGTPTLFRCRRQHVSVGK